MKSDTIAESIKAFVGSLGAVVRNTHASVAIVGASIIAEDLRGALLSRMRPLNKSLERRLFEGYGPLSSWSSRIDMAFALGVVSGEIRDDLNRIRLIRNAFAHSKKILHFNDPEIAERCRKLRTWEAGKTDLRAVYMESLHAIDRYLEEVARKGQPGKGKAG
jgi:DNA-binding MltR family transcriptional regulator